jgi:hypothetical protein
LVSVPLLLYRASISGALLRDAMVSRMRHKQQLPLKVYIKRYRPINDPHAETKFWVVGYRIDGVRSSWMDFTFRDTFKECVEMAESIAKQLRFPVLPTYEEYLRDRTRCEV